MISNSIGYFVVLARYLIGIMIGNLVFPGAL